jgi:hypothetical protein
MYCALCASNNQAELAAEINIHFRGLRNLDEPGILVFPKLLVCLDCGFSWFTTPKEELELLAMHTVTREGSCRQKSFGEVALCA